MAEDLRMGIDGGHERASDATGQFARNPGPSFSEIGASMKKAKQNDVVKYVCELDSVVPAVNDEAEGASNGFVYWDPSEDPGRANLATAKKPLAVAYVNGGIKQLATCRRLVFLNKEQRVFLAWIASHAQTWEEFISAKNKGDLEATALEQMKILICFPGRAWKSEFVKIVCVCVW